jgi:hypothetical protein
LPARRLLLAGPAGHDRDPVGHQEAGVEADAELTDQIRAILAALGLLERGQELLGARAGDGAEVLDRLVAGHADAVVVHGEHARRGIDLDADVQLLGR